MTFKQLRNKLLKKSPQLIRWNKSGIIEMAEITETYSVHITNLVSKHHYTLPLVMKDLDVEMVTDEMIKIGDLVPKWWRSSL